MNVAPTQPMTGSARVLEGRVAIITGSTSGIGLGIARAFASAGASAVINGFGKPEEITDTIEGLQRETDTKAVYSPADMTKPDEIAGMVNLPWRRSAAWTSW
jgi:3-hydroxybutyrate dehydrogenase